MRFTQRLKELDDQVLGRPVPDDRPLWQQTLRPRPAVSSRRGRTLYGLIIIGMFAFLLWGPQSLLGVLAFVPLLAAAFVVVAADERKRARRFHDN